MSVCMYACLWVVSVYVCMSVCGLCMRICVYMCVVCLWCVRDVVNAEVEEVWVITAAVTQRPRRPTTDVSV